MFCNQTTLSQPANLPTNTLLQSSWLVEVHQLLVTATEVRLDHHGADCRDSRLNYSQVNTSQEINFGSDGAESVQFDTFDSQ